MTYKTEWQSKCGQYYVELSVHGNRRYLYSNNPEIQIVFNNSWMAEQITAKGDVKKWLFKKAEERVNSTAEWIDKLEDQLAIAKLQHKEWQKFQKVIKNNL